MVSFVLQLPLLPCHSCIPTKGAKKDIKVMRVSHICVTFIRKSVQKDRSGAKCRSCGSRPPGGAWGAEGLDEGLWGEPESQPKGENRGGARVQLRKILPQMTTVVNRWWEDIAYSWEDILVTLVG